MRTVIEIPDEDIAAIAEVTAKLGISRAEFVRRAVATALLPYRKFDDAEAFGILAETVEDGLLQQERLRSEWG